MTQPEPTWLKTRLSVMMFLQYAIWGAWLPILFPFLMGHRELSLAQTGWVLAAGAAGAIVGPFVAGQIADRWFATQRFLALSHLVGAGLVWMLATSADYTSILVISAAYGLVYSPTLALTNSLSFHHLVDRDRDFGRVRLWGTIGWIVVGIGVGQWLLHEHTPTAAEDLVTAAQNAGRADAFKLSAFLGVVMAGFCMTLPHTPPAAGGEGRSSATVAALGEIRKQPLVVLFLLAVPMSCVHQFYFVFTADFLSAFGRDTAATINKIFGVGGGGLMTIGQMAEIAVLAAIPLLAKSWSRKSLLALGIIAYAARMALFAYTDGLPTILLGVALHGLCFGCFIFVAFMVVDENTSKDVRATAQNLFNLVIVGIGIVVGSRLSTRVGEWAQKSAGIADLKTATDADKAEYWTKLFSVPMYASIACLALLLIFYRGRRPEEVA